MEDESTTRKRRIYAGRSLSFLTASVHEKKNYFGIEIVQRLEAMPAFGVTTIARRAGLPAQSLHQCIVDPVHHRGGILNALRYVMAIATELQMDGARLFSLYCFNTPDDERATALFLLSIFYRLNEEDQRLLLGMVHVFQGSDFTVPHEVFVPQEVSRGDAYRELRAYVDRYTLRFGQEVLDALESRAIYGIGNFAKLVFLPRGTLYHMIYYPGNHLNTFVSTLNNLITLANYLELDLLRLFSLYCFNVSDETIMQAYSLVALYQSLDERPQDQALFRGMLAAFYGRGKDVPLAIPYEVRTRTKKVTPP